MTESPRKCAGCVYLEEQVTDRCKQANRYYRAMVRLQAKCDRLQEKLEDKEAQDD